MKSNFHRMRLAATARQSLAPFLYQTRTLSSSGYRPLSQTQPCSASGTHGAGSPQSDKKTNTRTGRDNVPRPRRSYLQKKAAVASAPHQKSSRAVTMTVSEKQKFSELLEQLGLASEEKPTEPDEIHKSELKGEDKNEMAQISAIFDSVLHELREKKKRLEKLKNANLKNQKTNPDLDLSNADIPKLLENDEISMDQAIEAIAHKECAKIEAALNAAVTEGKGDTEIWEICKQRIFSLLPHLEDAPSSPDDVAVDTPQASPLDVPASVSVDLVVTAMYPKTLLMAFRLLNLHFPTSPLISQFRSHIKSRGRASLVVGTSTALYNELIDFYWRGCHDLPEVLTLLQEMDEAGVEPNARTCGLLAGILNQRERDLKRHWWKMRKEERGSVREPYWDLAPNRKAIRELIGPDGWLHRLERRIQDRKAREATPTTL
ncbi:hypothetical protein BDV25DRAFT_166655 [Aspergillus avenaceus]|uniref:Mtf2-like C-terminal domain-containing protein n=1 Tax=Aspergillus avenaceus TaxID=36643 RepID=A0A5N6TE00_ASPAV|nr:hypothetical protein BDV25DRAFT_166655 [Aspergillus avenaceus]